MTGDHPGCSGCQTWWPLFQQLWLMLLIVGSILPQEFLHSYPPYVVAFTLDDESNTTFTRSASTMPSGLLFNRNKSPNTNLPHGHTRCIWLFGRKKVETVQCDCWHGNLTAPTLKANLYSKNNTGDCAGIYRLAESV